MTEHEGAELMRWASRGEQEMRREWISEVTWAPFDAGQRGRFGEAEYTQWLNGQGIAMILWILATPLLTGTIWTMGDELPRSNPPLHREAGKMEIDFKFWTAAQRFLPQDVWVRIMSQKFVDSQFCPAKMSAYLGSLISSRTLEDWHEPLYV
ncbi:MAG: hypothetical protein JJE13_08935 [Thermoleophilia bacterium]|nr:hypothetical protein [Thermoleophilia bacterium]